MPDSLYGCNPLGQSANIPSADTVAAVVARAATVDSAAEALRSAGWQSSVAGKRINVNNRVFARFVDGSAGPPTWVVYGIGDQPAVRIVVAGPQADVWNQVG